MSVLGLPQNRLLAFDTSPVSFQVNQFQINGLYQFPISGTGFPDTWEEVATTISDQTELFNIPLNPRQPYLIDYTIYATSEEILQIIRNVYMGMRFYTGTTPITDFPVSQIIAPGDTYGFKFVLNLPVNHGYTEFRITWRVNDTALRPVYLGDRNATGTNQGGAYKIMAL
jgi:hypothetical protein